MPYQIQRITSYIGLPTFHTKIKRWWWNQDILPVLWKNWSLERKLPHLFIFQYTSNPGWTGFLPCHSSTLNFSQSGSGLVAANSSLIIPFQHRSFKSFLALNSFMDKTNKHSSVEQFPVQEGENSNQSVRIFIEGINGI